MDAPACRWIDGPPAARVEAFRAAARAAEHAPWCEAVVAHARAWWGLPGDPPCVPLLRWFHSHVPYVAAPDDGQGRDFFCEPAYVLAHGGDCDQLAALLAALLETSGHRTKIVWVAQPGQVRDHVTVQVWLWGAWRWCEPCVPGARIGEDPWTAAERLNVRF